MKKIVCLVVVFLMVAAVAIAAKKMVIKEKDLPGLKGTWEGILSFGVFEAGGTSPFKLEILNDSLPVKGRLTIRNVPELVAHQFGTQAGLQTTELEDGIITSQGTLMWVGPAKNFLEISLLSDKKLGAYYYFRGMRGDATLKKK